MAHLKELSPMHGPVEHKDSMKCLKYSKEIYIVLLCLDQIFKKWG